MYWSAIRSFRVNLPLLRKLVADAKEETEFEKLTKKVHETKKCLEIITKEIESARRHLLHSEDEQKIEEARIAIDDLNA